MKKIKAEDLIKNNAITNIEVNEGQTVVFTEIALTAVNIAREEVKQKWEKACAAFIKDEKRVLREKALNAFLECEGYDDFERAISK